MAELQTLAVAFQAQLSEVMEAAAKTAMFEVGRLVEELLFVEVRRRDEELESLRLQLQWTAKEDGEEGGASRRGKCVECGRRSLSADPNPEPDPQEVKNEEEPLDQLTSNCGVGSLPGSSRSLIAHTKDKQLSEEEEAVEIKEEDVETPLHLRLWSSSSQDEAGRESSGEADAGGGGHGLRSDSQKRPRSLSAGDGNFLFNLSPGVLDQEPELRSGMFGDSPESSLSFGLSEDACVAPPTIEDQDIKQPVDAPSGSASLGEPGPLPHIVSVRGSCFPAAALDGGASASGVTVMTMERRSQGKRMYNKRFYCVYCSTPHSKMARHLAAKHKGEAEVERAFRFPKGSKERQVRLRLLRNRGNRAHNNQVLQAGRGLVIPLKQSNAPANASDYMHCPNCEAYVKRKFLRRHMQTCQEALSYELGAKRVHKPLGSKPAAAAAAAGLNPNFMKLLLEMHQNQVMEAICNDRLILRLGEELYLKHAHDAAKNPVHIRQRMRDAGRLLLQGRTTGKLHTIGDFILPSNFPDVVEAVQHVAGFDPLTNTYRTPSLIMKLRHILKKVSVLAEWEATNAGDATTACDALVFREMCDSQWVKAGPSPLVTKTKEEAWETPQMFDFTEDVRKIWQHLNSQRKQLQSIMGEEPSQEGWEELAKVTLCEMILFNRWRDRDVSPMPLGAPALLDQELSMTQQDKMLSQHFSYLTLTDGKGRHVPAFVTPDVLASIRMLDRNRLECGVPQENPFMFARPKERGHLRGSEVILHICHSCGVKHPQAMASGKLRTHTAAMMEVLALKDTHFLSELLGSRKDAPLGPTPRGHAQQLPRVTGLLLARYRGRSLQPYDKVLVDSEASDCEEDKAPPPSSERSCDHDSPEPTRARAERRRWSEEEVEAVEKTLLHCIRAAKVPCKAQCVACIRSSPRALSARSWQNVKFYVKNRIDTSKKDSCTPRR